MNLYIFDTCFFLGLGFYLLQNLQWYNYNLWRVFTKHSKPLWHLVFLFIPIILFFVLEKYFAIVAGIYCVLLGFWFYKLDKKLVFTNRIKGFFGIYIVLLAINLILMPLLDSRYFGFVALFFALLISYLSEAYLMYQYKKSAKEKLDSMPNLKIIAITASFGKTSIKNFIFELLSKRYNAYATPRSVNTINGIIKDINENLKSDCEFYIVEAGARARGDILKIAKLLNPQIAVIGEIGEAHLQYFKTLENIKATKYELLQSERLECVFLHKNNEVPSINAEITIFPPELKNVYCDLDITRFELKINGDFYAFECNILGNFNISNISVAILLAHKFNIEVEYLQFLIKNLAAIPHRLEKIEVNNNIILDDSFNGNLAGVLEAIRLCYLYQKGRRVIVTPGLVETSENNNLQLAKAINKVFDIAIITGELNSNLLNNNITCAQKIILKDKMNLQAVLANFCKDGDLVLFANDAPSYI